MVSSFELRAVDASPDGPAMVNLPSELLYQIAAHLSITTHAYLSATCRRLQAVLVPELYKRDRSTSNFRTLSWAACTRRSHAVTAIERAVTYWPPGIASLQCYFKKDKVFCGKSLKHLTPLMAAVQAGNFCVVDFLLAQGVDIHQHEKVPGHRDTLWYPIHHAVMMDHFRPSIEPCTTRNKLAVIELLLNHGANPNQMSFADPCRKSTSESPGIVTPMHLAIKNKADHRVIDLLIGAGAAATRVPYYQVPDQPYTNITPISHLVTTCNEATESQYLAVKSLTVHGGGIGSEAHMYTVTGHPLLLESLSRPRVSRYSVGITELILDHTWVRIEDTAHNGDGVIVHHLKKHIGWKPIKPYDRRLILRHEEYHDMVRLAATSCDTIEVLLRHGANINQMGALGKTPLHIASGLHQHYSSIFFYLMDCGANVRATTSEGHTILHTLVMGDEHADYTLVTCLIKKYKLDRYARDKEGNTFLHHLCQGHIVSFSKWMVEVAKHYKRSDFKDPKLYNKAGETPFDTVMSYREGEGISTQFWIDHAFDDAEREREEGEANFPHRRARKGRKKSKDI